MQHFNVPTGLPKITPSFETMRKLKPLFDRIAQEHAERRPPVKYDAWSAPKNSKAWQMRGVKGCRTCSGNGYVWVNLGRDMFGWIRCATCKQTIEETMAIIY